MKKDYEEPEVNLIEQDEEDVICSSNQCLTPCPLWGTGSHTET